MDYIIFEKYYFMLDKVLKNNLNYIFILIN